MRRTTLTLALLATTFGPLAVSAPARADETGSAMADAARRFLAALDDDQRSKAAFAFDSPERLNWHWIPRPRNGVPIKALTPEQRALAFGLVDTGLSTKGMTHATTIMSLEAILRDAEKGTGPVRDPELYFFSVFGTPEDAGTWGWRVEGHHLALNFTLKDGKVVSATPFMFGSNPATVLSGPRKGLRNLAEIEGPANALLASLTPEQRQTALVAPKAPEVTTTPNSPQPDLSTPRGIAAAQLDADQRHSLQQLLGAYVANFPDPIRSDLIATFASDLSTVHFAWSGPADPTQNHSFVVQGPAFVIDFNETQDKVNHIHTFVRSAADFALPAGR